MVVIIAIVVTVMNNDSDLMLPCRLRALAALNHSLRDVIAKAILSCDVGIREKCTGRV